MSRSNLVSTLGVALAGMLVAVPSAAHAERDVHDDRRHDVRRIDTTTDDQTPAPSRTDPDVRRTTVSHRPGRVVVRLEVADLRAGLGHLVAGRIRSAGGEVEFGWSQGPGEAMHGGVYLPGGGTCATPDPVFDTAADTVRVVVPRTCLDDPSWVRVGVGLTSFAGAAILHVDDARSDGVHDEAVLGPRLAAG